MVMLIVEIFQPRMQGLQVLASTIDLLPSLTLKTLNGLNGAASLLHLRLAGIFRDQPCQIGLR